MKTRSIGMYSISAINIKRTFKCKSEICLEIECCMTGNKIR